MTIVKWAIAFLLGYAASNIMRSMNEHHKNGVSL